ncbi:Apolipoprotein L domain containing protein 1 [Dissostichus eleginoides]|uniref:Apolipoprotein L domain containing protein 1 n=1 Tax=Dissostichus eleginoides TaxID=100907 RepID=A0AAD9F625_DISEL|nr:Apolipoprotein L domain containing protein 1 [Dissostichus eleginoides]
MRGDTTKDNEVEAADEHGGSAEAATGERRSSIETLQNMLKSQSPFQSQYTTLVSTSDSNGSSMNESRKKQDDQFLIDLAAAADVTDKQQLNIGQSVGQETPHLNPQNGVSGGLDRSNPFYTNYLESGHVMEDERRKTSEAVNLEAILVHPPEFQSSPLDLQPEKNQQLDVFGMTSSNTAPEAVYSTSSVGSQSDIKLDMLSSPDLFKTTSIKAPPPAVRPKPSIRQHDIILTTPQGSTHDILQPSPFSRARNLSMTPSQSAAENTHVSNFKRPPKPLPRTRPTRTEKTPLAEKPPERPPPPTNHIETTDKPEKPERPPAPANPIAPEAIVPKTSPKPAFRPLSKPKPLEETKEFVKENFAVFEDVLLMGQERCIEDWPEDSPQLNPQFKPSGTLRLRRESMRMKMDSEGGSVEDLDGFGVKKKDKKFRLSILSRRSSKKISEERRSTLPTLGKSSKEYLSETNMSTEEKEDWEQYGMDYKKKNVKTKVNKLLRRASTNSSVLEGKQMNGHLPQDLKAEEIRRQRVSKKGSTVRRWSETGAHGYTPRKNSKERSQDELFGAHGYTPRKKSQVTTPCSSVKLLMDDKHFQKTRPMSAGFNGDEDPYEMEDCKPKKPTKMKMLQTGRRSSKENMLDDNNAQKKKGSFSAEELDDDEWMEDCKPKTSKKKGPLTLPRKSAKGQSEATGFSQQNPQQAASDPFAEDDFTQTGKDFMSPGEYSEEGEVETCKPKKKSKLKGFKKHKTKSKANHPEYEDPPGATSADFLSEAARAEWLAAQMDEQALEELEDDYEDGDTDSLMEWWHTVEQWDEVPSDDEDKVLKEDESKSFTVLADKVQRGLRVFNKIFTERAEFLWQSILRLHAIADDINTFHHKAKIAGITGGTTTAVGGVAAIAGLALAPFTLGVSLVITAVGVGVATAGGIASASAAISDNVHNLHDRKKVEIVLGDYEAHLLAIGKILHFVNQGLIKLRGHPFLRSGTQHYSKDWEIRRAVQMISLVDTPVMRGTEITDNLVASVQRLFTGMDKYFAKDSRELKKGCKKEVVCQIKEVANVLNVGIVDLNSIREELQDATGNM